MNEVVNLFVVNSLVWIYIFSVQSCGLNKSFVV